LNRLSSTINGAENNYILKGENPPKVLMKLKPECWGELSGNK